MFESSVDFGLQCFSALILLVVASLSSSIMYGVGTRKARETFIGLVFFSMLGYQFYYLILLSNYLPAFPYTYDSSLIRHDCTSSVKGGKRPSGRKMKFDINPCFCHTGAECVDPLTNIVHSTNNSCPTTGLYKCYDTNNKVEVPLYNSDERDCAGGFGAKCTRDAPCDPCERTSLIAFNAPRCATCSTDFDGNCNFIPGIGPYCRVSPDSKAVEPCRKCCTEATLLFDAANGTRCY